MKSMFPDQEVAITGFPRAIASVIVSPVPSERCRETYASHAAIKSRNSCDGQYSVWMAIGYPRARAFIAAKPSGSDSEFTHLIIK
jgi:hypothetical protein